MSSTWGFKSLYPHQQSQNPQFNSKHSLLCGSGSVVERCLAKADIAGPNPVSRSMLRHVMCRSFFINVIRTRVVRGDPRIPPQCSLHIRRYRGFFLDVIRTRVVRGDPRIPSPCSLHIRKYRRFFIDGIRTRRKCGRKTSF